MNPISKTRFCFIQISMIRLLVCLDKTVGLVIGEVISIRRKITINFSELSL